MTSERDIDSNGESHHGDSPVAPWVRQALTEARSVLHRQVLSDMDVSSSSDFLQKCADAGQLAADIARLRQARQQLGFLPFPVDGYLRRLAKNAGVTLAPILAWCGIDASSSQDIISARGWARLAKEIGLGLREALVHTRLSFAEALSPRPVPVRVRRRQAGHTRRTRLDEYERLVDEIVAQWDQEALAKLSTAETEIREMYGFE